MNGTKFLFLLVTCLAVANADPDWESIVGDVEYIQVLLQIGYKNLQVIINKLAAVEIEIIVSDSFDRINAHVSDTHKKSIEKVLSLSDVNEYAEQVKDIFKDTLVDLAEHLYPIPIEDSEEIKKIIRDTEIYVAQSFVHIKRSLQKTTGK